MATPRRIIRHAMGWFLSAIGPGYEHDGTNRYPTKWGGWRGCWHGLCARRAPTIKRWSLDARSGDHTNNLAEVGEELRPALLDGCRHLLITLLLGWLLN
jgi:hypothetical protein